MAGPGMPRGLWPTWRWPEGRLRHRDLSVQETNSRYHPVNDQSAFSKFVTARFGLRLCLDLDELTVSLAFER